MATIYEKKSGKAVECETVDAAEMCSGKNAFYTKVDPSAPESGSETPNLNKLNKSDLQAMCFDAGVTYEPDATKADLIALLEVE